MPKPSKEPAKRAGYIEYPGDMQGELSRATWTNEQWGVFRKIRDYMWLQKRSGFIVNDQAALKKITGAEAMDDAHWKQVLRSFKRSGKYLYDQALVKQAGTDRAYSKQQSENSSKGWIKRRMKNEPPGETVLWRGIAWPEWALKKLRLEVVCESDALKLAVDSLPQLEHTNPKKAALVKAERALYQADLTIMNATLKSIDAVLAAPAAHRGPGKVKVEWNGKEWYPSELVAELAQKREIKAALALPLTVNGKNQTLCACLYRTPKLGGSAPPGLFARFTARPSRSAC